MAGSAPRLAERYSTEMILLIASEPSLFWGRGSALTTTLIKLLVVGVVYCCSIMVEL